MSDVPPTSGDGAPGAGGPPPYPGAPPAYPDPTGPPLLPGGGAGGYSPPGGYPPPGGGYGAPGGYPPPGGVPGYAPVSPFASFGTRLGGWLIDWLILAIVGLLVDKACNGLHVARITFQTTKGHGATAVTHVNHVSVPASIINLLIILLYGAFLCGSARGQTLGMMIVKARAVDADTGAPIGFGRALGRAAFEVLLFLALFVPWVVDMLFPAWDGRRQTLHDKVARTVVVRTTGVPPV